MAMHRRDFMGLASGALLLPSAGAYANNLSFGGCKDVVVGTWGGDYLNLLDRNIGKPIVQASGGSVTYDSADQVARITKLRAEKASRRGSLDIACFGDIDMSDMSRAGLIDNISASDVPNLANTIESLRKPYSIPHIYSALGIVYSPERFGGKIDALEVMMDPKLKGKIGFSDILFNFNVWMAAIASGNKDGTPTGGMEYLRELKKKQQPKVYPSNEAVAAALKSGEIWFTCMWKARALQWTKGGVPVEFVVAKEGGVLTAFEAGIPKNSRNKGCAMKYLDAMLTPEAQRAFAETMGYAPTVKNANLPKELQDAVGFNDSELARLLTPNYARSNEMKPEILDFWTKEFKVGL